MILPFPQNLRDHLEHLLVQAEYLLNLDSFHTEIAKHDIEKCL